MIDPTMFLASNTVEIVETLIGKLFPAIKNYLTRPENKRLLRSLTWALCVVVILGLTAGALFGLHSATGSYKPGIVTSVVLWSLFLGITAVVSLPSKAIIATFGALLGVSVSEIATAAGLLSVVRKQAIAIAIQLGGIVDPSAPLADHPDPFITWMIWLFVAITAILCLPAFFDTQGPIHEAPGHKS
jgi:hypothetical protein